MEQITIGQISIMLTFLVGLISAVTYLSANMRKWLKLNLKDDFTHISQQIDSMDVRIREIDIQTCKNFLVARLGEVEKGIPLNEIERERFWEQYEHYRTIGGNSYIVRKVEQLKAEQKI